MALKTLACQERPYGISRVKAPVTSRVVRFAEAGSGQPGPRGGGDGVWRLMGTEFRFYKMRRSRGADRRDGCPATGRRLKPRNRALEND